MSEQLIATLGAYVLGLCVGVFITIVHCAERRNRASLNDRRVEFYDDLKSMAERIDTMGKFGVGITAVAHYRRSDGTRFKLSVEKVES